MRRLIIAVIALFAIMVPSALAKNTKPSTHKPTYVIRCIKKHRANKKFKYKHYRTIPCQKLKTHNGKNGEDGTNGQNGAPGKDGATGLQGKQGLTGQSIVGPQGQTGVEGPAGTPILFESNEGCTPELCIDASPGPEGLAGAGGWGWNSVTNGPVTALEVGTSNPLAVTVLQPVNEHANGTITLTWDPYDFEFEGNTDKSAVESHDPLTGNEVSFSYTDLAHTSKTDAFHFKALHEDPDAVITATVFVNGQEAWATFPVAIS